MMEEIAYFKNRFLPLSDVHLSPLDSAFSRAYAINDFIRVYNGVPFRLEEHLERFCNSAKSISLLPCPSTEELSPILSELLEKNALAECNIRLYLLGGHTLELLPETPPHLFAYVKPFHPYPERYYNEGLKLKTVEVENYSLEAKTTSYIPAILARKAALSQGADEALLVEKGSLLEAPTANFFGVIGNRLITPSKQVLKGITRKVVLEIASGDFLIEEREVSFEEIPFFDEAFLTSTTREVMPIASIDGHLFPFRKATALLRSRFTQITRFENQELAKLS